MLLYSLLCTIKFSPPPPPPASGDTWEWAMKMRGKWVTLIHFAPLEVRGCVVAFTHVHDALGRGNTEKYSISSCCYARECGRIDNSWLIPAWGRCSRHWNSSGNYKKKKLLRGQCDCLQMFFMGAVEFIKSCPPWGRGIQAELISLKINSTTIPQGRGAVEYIDWCITLILNSVLH